jgi:hypothetical protein
MPISSMAFLSISFISFDVRTFIGTPFLIRILPLFGVRLP